MIMVATRRLKEYARTNPLVIISNLARRRNCSEKEQTGLSTWSMTLLRVQLSIFGPGSRGWYLLYRCGARWTSINFVLFSFLVCLLLLSVLRRKRGKRDKVSSIRHGSIYSTNRYNISVILITLTLHLLPPPVRVSK